MGYNWFVQKCVSVALFGVAVLQGVLLLREIWGGKTNAMNIAFFYGVPPCSLVDGLTANILVLGSSASLRVET
jgi:hypothetical protein